MVEEKLEEELCAGRLDGSSMGKEVERVELLKE